MNSHNINIQRHIIEQASISFIYQLESLVIENLIKKGYDINTKEDLYTLAKDKITAVNCHFNNTTTYYIDDKPFLLKDNVNDLKINQVNTGREITITVDNHQYYLI